MFRRFLIFLPGTILAACVDGPSTPNAPVANSVAAATFVGAGDIAGCSTSYGDETTARLILNIPGVVYTLGDNAYPSGTSNNFTACYAPSWGQVKSRTRPAPGNHDYATSGAAGYFGYFGSMAGPCCRGYYSYQSAAGGFTV